MDLRIDGGYQAYVYVVLLQLSTFYLQRLDLNRRMAEDDEKALSPAMSDYLLTTRFVAAGLNWASWLLAVFVWQEFGLANAVLFLLLGLGSSIIPIALIPPLPIIDVFAHVLSLPATAYLFRATLVAVRFWNPT
jgi:hypothetical protein